MIDNAGDRKMIVNDVRSRLVGDLYEYIRRIITRAIQHNKKIIIWGCGKGGAFLRHLICDIDGRISISYYIDEYMVLPVGSEKLHVFRSSLLRYISNDEYVILLSIRSDKSVERLLQNMGYIKGDGYFDVRGDVGGSYLEFLEIKYAQVDYGYVTKDDRPELYSGEYYESKPFDHSSIDHVFDEICALPCEKKFFDIGCGKGQILLMAAMSGMDIIAGIDFNGEIVEIAKKNLQLLKIDGNIICDDATTYENFDNFNIFFLYNPFGEESIRKVINNIKNSQKRCNRSVFLVYGNPFYHDAIVDLEGVSLHRQVIVDLYDPIMNIYRIGD